MHDNSKHQQGITWASPSEGLRQVCEAATTQHRLNRCPFTFQHIHKWAWGGSIQWVCGFLLTLQAPLHPTQARKQIKLQFHHLEGAVSCPNSALSPQRLPPPTHPDIHTHTKLYTSASSESLGSPAPKMPVSFHCSIAERNGGIWGKKEGKRGMGGLRGKGDWEYAQGSYCSFIPEKKCFFAVEET